jgi:hypothetical protein
MNRGNQPTDETATSSGAPKQRQGSIASPTAQVQQTINQAQQQTVTQANTQKERATKSLSALAQAVRQAGGSLRQQQETPIAQVAEQAAERIDKTATYLRSHSVTDMLDEAEQFTQRQPVLVLAGAFAVGVVATRFLKSRSQRMHPQQSPMQHASSEWRPNTPDPLTDLPQPDQTSPTISAQGSH